MMSPRLPDPEPDPAVLGHLRLAVDHRALDLRGAAHGVNNTGKFRQPAVAGILDGTAFVLPDLRVDELAAMRLEPFVRAFLVRSHQARIARHIGGEDRGETADSGHCSPGAMELSREAYPQIVQSPNLYVDSRIARRPLSRAADPADREAAAWPTQRKGTTPSPGLRLVSSAA
jgi:hypothetical protein